MRKLRDIANFWRDRAGAVAVEFALLTPVAITLFMGMFELTQVLLAHMKLVNATEVAADLLGQQKAVCVSDVTGFGTAASLVMEPFSPNLKVEFASIKYSSGGVPSIDWHQEVNGATALTLTPTLTTSLETLGTTTSDSVVIAQTTYTYTSPISYVLPRSFTFSEESFVRPRFVVNIPKPTTGC
jgi:Flp pilus assembly protein TadG